MNKKKIVTICLVFALVAVASLGTLAYFTDKEVANNTFTIGDVDIALDETAITTDSSGNIIADPSKPRVQENTYDFIFPAQTIAKDPTVTNEGPYDAYIRTDLKIEPNVLKALHIADKATGEINLTNLKNVLTGGILASRTSLEESYADLGTSNYALVATSDGTFSFYGPRQSEGQGYTIFEKVEVPADLTNDDFKILAAYKDGFKMDVYAYAIQANGFANSGEAYAALGTTAEEANEVDIKIHSSAN